MGLAAVNGHHVPGTSFNWRHGFIPLNLRTARRWGKLADYRERRDTSVVERSTAKSMLRMLSDNTIAKLYDRYRERHGVEKALASELDHRDRAERAKRKVAAKRAEHADAVHAQFLQAEANTRGNMLSRAGERAGVDPQSLFTGPERRAEMYASEELRKFWDRHPRLTVTEFMRQSRQPRESPPRQRGLVATPDEIAQQIAHRLRSVNAATAAGKVNKLRAGTRERLRATGFTPDGHVWQGTRLVKKAGTR